MDKKHTPTIQGQRQELLRYLKKEIHALAKKAKFSEAKIGEIDIVVAEMASNLNKHAKEGEILANIFEDERTTGIELICTDEGPGITDLNRMMTDGISTKNTLGHGLGAMRRLSDDFQVYSKKEWGTMILSRLYQQAPPPYLKPPPAEIKAVLIPKPGLDICGDGFYTISVRKKYGFSWATDSEHGIEAHRAVAAAGEAFKTCQEEAPNDIIRYINQAVKKTRGLVGTVAIFNRETKVWNLCGVGNINTKISVIIIAKPICLTTELLG